MRHPGKISGGAICASSPRYKPRFVTFVWRKVTFISDTHVFQTNVTLAETNVTFFGDNRYCASNSHGWHVELNLF